MAVSFASGGDRIDCGACNNLDAPADISIAGWINEAAYGFLRIITKAPNTVADGWILNFPNTNRLQWYVNYVNVAGAWYSPAASLTASVWDHIVVTYNFHVDSDPIFYINGLLAATTEIAGPQGAYKSDAAYNVIIGADTGGGNGFSGLMEHMRVYSRILAAEEAALLAAGHRGPIGGEELWIDMQLARGAYTGALTQGTHIFNDLSGNGNDGDPYGEPSLVASTCPRIGVLL